MSYSHVGMTEHRKLKSTNLEQISTTVLIILGLKSEQMQELDVHIVTVRKPFLCSDLYLVIADEILMTTEETAPSLMCLFNNILDVNLKQTSTPLSYKNLT